MSQTDPPWTRLPRGVTLLSRARGGRSYRASIRRGKGVEIHLGLYETRWLAAFAYGVAAKALGREGGAPVEIPLKEQPTADEVVAIAARVHRRLGLGPKPRREEEHPPDPDDLLILFEVAVVGYWRSQAGEGDWDRPGGGADAASGRLLDAAGMLFWRRGPGELAPLDVLTRLLTRRVETTFRRGDLVREILDDDGDEPRRVARWLVLPDGSGAGRGRGFREEVRHLYRDLFAGDDPGDDGPPPAWADVLGLAPPLTAARIRAAYLKRSRAAHPDAGGSDAEFIRLRAAYEEGMAYVDDRLD